MCSSNRSEIRLQFEFSLSFMDPNNWRQLFAMEHICPWTMPVRIGAHSSRLIPDLESSIRLGSGQEKRVPDQREGGYQGGGQVGEDQDQQGRDPSALRWDPGIRAQAERHHQEDDAGHRLHLRRQL